MSARMVLFRRLSVASLVATFALVGIGGLVRATKSGLGCGTDWPHCNGALAPVIENRAVAIELSHRLAAAVVVVLLATLALLAVRHQRHVPRIKRASIAAFGLVMFQAVLGAVVVKLELEASSVVLHLATALSLVAVLTYVVVATYAEQGRLRIEADARLSRRSAWVAGSVLALLLVGSYVSSFPDRPPQWPLIDGRLIPDLANQVFAAHWIHRGLAAIVGIALFVYALPLVRRKREMPVAARLAHVALGVFVAEILIGAANVWTDLNAGVVTLHLLAGALIWGAVVAVALVTRPALAVVADGTQRRTRAGVALEGN